MRKKTGSRPTAPSCNPFQAGPPVLDEKNPPPYFIYRPTRVSDLEACWSLLKAPYAQDPSARKDLMAFWRRLVESGSAATGVIEDRALGAKLVGFGLGFFATEVFIRESLKEPPFLALRAARQWKKGKRPFLNREEIARANGPEGLRLITLNFGSDNMAYGPKNLLKLIGAITQQNFHKVHDGFRLVEIVGEIFGPTVRDGNLSIGLKLLTDYVEFKKSPVLAGLSDADWPYLMGIKAEQSGAPKINLAFSIFNRYSPPRFHFRPGEQAVLEEALAGTTDGEIAERLDASFWTVKKRWRILYEKVSKVDPELVPEELPGERGTRQKRRHLLNYLKDHLEELRPHAVPRKRKRKA